MGKLFRALVLVAGIGVLASASGLVAPTPAPAQAQKDKDKKSAAKEEIGVTEVFKAKDGWRFRIKNTEDKSIAGGYNAYDTKEDALKAVDFLKATLAKGKVEVLKEEKK